jgi:hybrid cluster-associated redox disulfide protein
MDRELRKAGTRAGEIDAATPVDEVMRRRPSTIGVFLRLRLHCIGCPVGPFHSVSDAAREHDIDVQELLAALRSST